MTTQRSPSVSPPDSPPRSTAQSIRSPAQSTYTVSPMAEKCHLYGVVAVHHPQCYQDLPASQFGKEPGQEHKYDRNYYHYNQKGADGRHVQQVKVCRVHHQQLQSKSTRQRSVMLTPSDLHWQAQYTGAERPPYEWVGLACVCCSRTLLTVQGRAEQGGRLPLGEGVPAFICLRARAGLSLYCNLH